MATVSNVQKAGNNLIVVMSDGTQYLALTTGNDMWLVSGSGGGGGGGDYSWPFDPRPVASGGTVTSEYGPRTGGAGTFHEGMDFGARRAVWGARVLCIGAGTIEGATSNAGYGPYITVFHGTFDGFDWYSRYGHLDSFSRWTVGQPITKGALVGLETDGGVSSGANLHMETHKCAIGGPIINDLVDHPGSTRTAINPRDFFDTYGDGGVLNP